MAHRWSQVYSQSFSFFSFFSPKQKTSRLTCPSDKPSTPHPSAPSPSPYRPMSSAPGPGPPPLAASVSDGCATTSSLSRVHCRSSAKSARRHPFKANPLVASNPAISARERDGIPRCRDRVQRVEGRRRRHTFALGSPCPSCRVRRCR